MCSARTAPAPPLPPLAMRQAPLNVPNDGAVHIRAEAQRLKAVALDQYRKYIQAHEKAERETAKLHAMCMGEPEIDEIDEYGLGRLSLSP